ncbi:MAG: tetratricopeptide repeat protein [Sulfuriferula sp.]|nr:tetratricopeptide repeat protein [Sulfuriferula sp.]
MTSDSSPSPDTAQIIERNLRQAIALHQADQLQEAETLYREIIKTQPEHPEANHNIGVLALQQQRAEASLPYFVTALEADPANGRYWTSYIDALCQAERFDEARQVLALAQQHGLQGDDVDALNTRLNGKPAQEEMNALVALFNAGQFNQAATLAHTLIARYPLHDAGWKALGVAYKQLGRSADALAPMQKAVELAPDDAEAHNNLGIIYNDLKRYADAETSYSNAIRLNPAYAQAYSNLGATLHDLKRLDEAEACYRKALQLNPDYAKALNNLGATLHDLRRLDEAEACYRKVLALDEHHADAHRNLGATLHDLDRLDEAAACYRYALRINPQDAEAHSYLGITLRDMGRLDDSETSLRRALEIDPHSTDGHYNLSHTLLMSGKYAEAWPKYEYRWNTRAYTAMQRPSTALPQWTGQTPQPADRLLVFREQGLGDQIQFCRYLPLAAGHFTAGVSAVVAQPLQALFRRSFPDIEILDSAPADQHAWQWQCPLLSLPLALGTTLETIPNRVPYLIADPIQSGRWQARIAALNLPAATRKIGLVWKPGSLMKNAALRALTLHQLAPLLNLDNCAWFSLQKEPDPDKAPWVASGKLIDWSDEFNDFDATAALMAHLDLVISVDTAVAHLAGALGRPVWLLNRRAGEWRWLHGRKDSPWYPTMRIFTQANNWDDVVERLVVALDAAPNQASAAAAKTDS